MIRTLLVALDSSSRAPAVLSAALEIMERFKARAHLLRVISVPPDLAAATSLPDPLPSFLEQKAKADLATIAARDARAASCPLLVRRAAQPWRGILEAADDVDADIIVVGSHGNQLIDRVLGTTAGSVANQAQRNILVVHTAALSG